jgi:hypothetical protein
MRREANADYQDHYQVVNRRLSIQAMRTTPRRHSVAVTFWRSLEVGHMFGMPYGTALFAGPNQAQAQEAWRDAASLVATRWQLFLEAEPESRAWAFACYVAALDAEEAAAADLAALSSRIAA